MNSFESSKMQKSVLSIMHSCIIKMWITKIKSYFCSILLKCFFSLRWNTCSLQCSVIRWFNYLNNDSIRLYLKSHIEFGQARIISVHLICFVPDDVIVTLVEPVIMQPMAKNVPVIQIIYMNNGKTTDCAKGALLVFLH